MNMTLKTKLSTLLWDVSFFGILIILCFSVAVWILINCVPGKNIPIVAIATLIITNTAIILGFLYQLITIVRYYKHDKKQLISIDTEKEILEFTREGQKETVPFSNIYFIYHYIGYGWDNRSYYKLVFKDPLPSGKENLIVTYLTTTRLHKDLKGIDYRIKRRYNLSLPKTKNNHILDPLFKTGNNQNKP